MDSIMLLKFKQPILYYLLFLSFSFLILASVDHYKIGGGKWILVKNYEQKVHSKNYLERIYSRLSTFDGQWYYWIAKKGYFCDEIDKVNNPHKCNVTFWPLGPLVGKLISGTLKIPLEYSIQIFNQVLTFFSFILLYLIVSNLNLLKFSHYFFLTLIFYPGSIYLLSSYSEPQVLFICLYFVNYLFAKKKNILLSLFVAYFFSLAKLTAAVFAFIPLIFDIIICLDRKNLQLKRNSIFLAVAGFLGHFSFHFYNYFNFNNFLLYFDAIAPWFNPVTKDSPWMVHSFFEGLKLNKGFVININNIYEYFHWLGSILFVFLFCKNRQLKIASIFVPAFILVSLCFVSRVDTFLNVDYIRRAIPTYIILFLTIVPLFSNVKFLKILMILNIIIGVLFSYKAITTFSSGIFL